LGFIASLYCPRAEMSLRCISWVGEVSPWPIISFWDLLQSVLQVLPLNDHPNCWTTKQYRQQSLFSDCFLLTGGDEGDHSIRADHEKVI
jgi:hypothetical protein